jgi:iron complex transport system ATP-binding protein
MNSFFFETRQLFIGFHNQNRIKIADLQLYKGQIIALLGKNGSGKSTFLKTISKQINPVLGQFFINQQPSTFFSAAHYSLILSLVHTDKIQVDFLTGWDLLVLGVYPRLGFWSKLTAKDTFFLNEIFDSLQINELKNKLINECSDGEKQLLLLGKAIAQNTDLILLDEITAHLDFENRKKVFILLNNIAQKQNKLIFISTHELELAADFSNQMLVFKQQKAILSDLNYLYQS